eukprot:sb/3475707/
MKTNWQKFCLIFEIRSKYHVSQALDNCLRTEGVTTHITYIKGREREREEKEGSHHIALGRGSEVTESQSKTARDRGRQREIESDQIESDHDIERGKEKNMETDPLICDRYDRPSFASLSKLNGI